MKRTILKIGEKIGYGGNGQVFRSKLVFDGEPEIEWASKLIFCWRRKAICQFRTVGMIRDFFNFRAGNWGIETESNDFLTSNLVGTRIIPCTSVEKEYRKSLYFSSKTLPMAGNPNVFIHRFPIEVKEGKKVELETFAEDEDQRRVVQFSEKDRPALYVLVSPLLDYDVGKIRPNPSNYGKIVRLFLSLSSSMKILSKGKDPFLMFDIHSNNIMYLDLDKDQKEKKEMDVYDFQSDNIVFRFIDFGLGSKLSPMLLNHDEKERSKAEKLYYRFTICGDRLQSLKRLLQDFDGRKILTGEFESLFQGYCVEYKKSKYLDLALAGDHTNLKKEIVASTRLFWTNGERVLRECINKLLFQENKKEKEEEEEGEEEEQLFSEGDNRKLIEEIFFGSYVKYMSSGVDLISLLVKEVAHLRGRVTKLEKDVKSLQVEMKEMKEEHRTEIDMMKKEHKKEMKEMKNEMKEDFSKQIAKLLGQIKKSLKCDKCGKVLDDMIKQQ